MAQNVAKRSWDRIRIPKSDEWKTQQKLLWKDRDELGPVSAEPKIQWVYYPHCPYGLGYGKPLSLSMFWDKTETKYLSSPPVMVVARAL